MLKDVNLVCEDVFRNKDELLSYEENNQYYKITDKENKITILPKFIICNGMLFKIFVDDLGFEGNFFIGDFEECTVTFNLRLRNIENFEYRFLEAVMFIFWHNIQSLRIESDITDDCYITISMALYNILKQNKIELIKNYNKFREDLFDIPKKINVLGTTYKVTMCKKLKANNEDVYGLFCNKLAPNFGIYIATEFEEKTLSKTTNCATFIHELTHAILFETGHDSSSENSDKEEQICDYMATQICDFLRSNDFEVKFN